MTTIVNCKNCKYDIYIGRPSQWGNPYEIGKDGNRLEVIQKYEEYIRNKPELLSKLGELENKILGCWCRPLACHGDVLIKLIQERKNNEKTSK